MIEAEKRRMELALFVAPRALATLFPRAYEANVSLGIKRWCLKANRMQNGWKEKVAFSLSMAVLFTLAHEDPRKVRGVLGRLIYMILQ